MTLSFFLFDMDGVLLHPRGYHQSLQNSVKRIGLALGAPNTDLSPDQIAQFEALNVTNEWDSLAICAALVLVHIWQKKGEVRLGNYPYQRSTISAEIPDFDKFLASFSTSNERPGHEAYHFLINDYPWLDSEQQAHLAQILHNCRDIYHSLTLAWHQETVLGSRKFHDTYGLEPQLNSESYLLNYDKPIMTSQQENAFRLWLAKPANRAGIMTNRPSWTPKGYISPPEAELGAKLVGLEDLPLLGSGLLGWFAVNQSQQNEFAFLKPNPVHALGLIQMCLGKSRIRALTLATDLWHEKGTVSDWKKLDGAKVVIFEDAVKGLLCGKAAQDLLAGIGIYIQLILVGVSNIPVKLAALKNFSDITVPNINDIHWNNL